MSIVRAAKISDARAINVLSRYLGYKPISDKTVVSRMEGILNSNITRLWAYENGGEVLAWMHVFLRT